MPRTPEPLRVLLVAAAVSAALPAAASEPDRGGRPVAAAAKAAAPGKPAVPPTATPAVPAAAEAPVPRAAQDPTRLPNAQPDPIEHLRRRLAEKLNAAPAAPTNPRTLQVAPPAPERVAAALPRVPAKPAAGGHGAAAGHAGTVHWSYDGAGGPMQWGALKPEFSTCAKGTRQSPIDFRDPIRVDLEPITFDYRPGGFRVVDNGHTIQVNLAEGNAIEVRGRRFELVQFHFHRPSEEAIDGRRYDMSLHLVHRDAAGKLAVVGLLLDAGAANPTLQQVWNNLPLEPGEQVAARQPLDPAALLPLSRGYFATMGSLTTPPCDEGVLWMVMQQPVQVSREQIGIFSRLYPMNARPLQPVGTRLIQASN
jgi:carbonic anhydrase